MQRRGTRSTWSPPADSRRAGFTLVELQIVISVIAIIATLIVPNLVASRLSGNEAAAIATLRTVVTAQAQFRESSKVDSDVDGTGEFGGFTELSGGGPGRMVAVLVPPVLTGGFRFLNPNGQVTRNGYLYRIFLPGAGGMGVGEPFGGFVPLSGIDEDLAESTWCCYAWPVHYAHSGNRTFFVNQGGDTLATDDKTYSGWINGPAADAAFTAPDTITGAVAVEAAGQDGNTWKPAR